MYDPSKIRNLAIIAHIDHGKTTLLDAMLKSANIFRENEAIPERVMDSYDQEKERGITIFAKHTSIFYGDYKINLIDTPGHADFSGEVERILGLVNCVLLLIDAKEGPMPQTRFVLSKALKMGLNPIVVLNKIDRPHADPDRALDKTFDLFVELGATDEQLDFAYCYASGISGFAMRNIDDPREDLRPLFEMILEKVPAPSGNRDLPFLFQATTLSYDDFIGRKACGRILEGEVKKGDAITHINRDGALSSHRVTRIEGYHGLTRVELEEAGVGDIVNICGIEEITIGDTLTKSETPEALPPIDLEEPTLSIELSVNSGPFVGRDGKHVTMNKIKERLMQEKRANISLRIEEVQGREDAMRVSGRGELHLSVLIEAMRREGFECTLSKPQVIIKMIDGEKCEPMEKVHIEVPEEFSGGIIEELSRRKAQMQELATNEHNITTMIFIAPTRALLGYRNDFLTATKGLGILTSIFEKFGPWCGDIPTRTRGVMIASQKGKATPYALFNLQDRGTIFVKSTQEIYEGMIVGEHSRDNDIIVNAAKEKQLTNVRAAGSDENVILAPPRTLNLEQAMNYIADDELVEVTPKAIRLRKKVLNESERKRKS